MNIERFSPVAYQHVVFDLDGTLVDSLADLAAAVNHTLRTLGAPQLTPTTVSGYIGAGARLLVERALGPSYRDRLEEGLELFTAYYGAHLLDRTRPYPGVVDLLSALRARSVRCSVLSNKPVAMSRSILDGLGLLPQFVAVLGGDSLPQRKPDPIGIEYLRTLTHSPRAQTLMVGDSAIDMHTAAAAGVAFCGAAWGFAPHGLRAAAPQLIISHPSELLAVVEGG